MVTQCKRYAQVDTGVEAVVLSLYQDAHALLVSAVPALPCRAGMMLGRSLHESLWNEE